MSPSIGAPTSQRHKFVRAQYVAKNVGSIFWTGWVCAPFQTFEGSGWFYVVQRDTKEIFLAAEHELTVVPPKAEEVG